MATSERSCSAIAFLDRRRPRHDEHDRNLRLRRRVDHQPAEPVLHHVHVDVEAERVDVELASLVEVEDPDAHQADSSDHDRRPPSRNWTTAGVSASPATLWSCPTKTSWCAPGMAAATWAAAVRRNSGLSDPARTSVGTSIRPYRCRGNRRVAQCRRVVRQRRSEALTQLPVRRLAHPADHVLRESDEAHEVSQRVPPAAVGERRMQVIGVLLEAPLAVCVDAERRLPHDEGVDRQPAQRRLGSECGA